MLVNEIFGSVALTIIAGLIAYLIIAGKLRFGAELTIAFGIPFILIASIAFGNFQPILAFVTVLAALMIAYIFNRITGNR